MTSSGRTGAAKLAAALATIAMVLAWCGVHLYHLLQSQQKCEMTYMYAKYTAVELSPSSLADNATTALSVIPGTTPSMPSLSSSVPEWATDLADAMARVQVALGGVGRTKYRLWRYTGDESSGSRRGSGLALPVLFIPGNGGSHEMGRSLASETARRVSRLGVRVLDPVAVHWYLLDLEGDWSAFDGELLEAQVRFTLAAMRHLATVYNITTIPTITTRGRANAGADATTKNPGARAAGHGSAAGQWRQEQGQQQGQGQGQRRRLSSHPGLMVVGHSMGGVVAADALSRAAEDPELGPSVAAMLVTLGSPLVRAPLPGQPSLQAFYAQAAARPRPVVPVVAIAGGAADVQVATALADPEKLAPQGLWRRLSLSDMAGGWCPSRHNGLVWCNQLVVALGQALVDLAQDALPGLAAARKAATAAANPSASTGSSPPVRADAGDGEPPANPAAAWAATQGLDPAQLERDVREEAANGSRPEDGDGSDGGWRSPSWDWALQRVDRHLMHPAQPYVAAALAAATAPPLPPLPPRRRQQSESGRSGAEVDGRVAEGPHVEVAAAAEHDDGEDVEGDEDSARLLRLAGRAMAPTAVGGAACGGANLAWYLQYGKPHVVKPGGGEHPAQLRLRPEDLGSGGGAIPATGHMFAWELNRKRPTGRSGSRDGDGGGGGGPPLGWAAVISGSSPCDTFRAWLSVKMEYPTAAAAAENAGGGESATARGRGRSNSGSSYEGAREQLEEEARRALAAPARTVRHDVEVTGLAAPLPAVTVAGCWRVRQRSDWYDIGQGRNYQSRAAWLLLLPPSLVLPLLEQTGAPPLPILFSSSGANRSRSGDDNDAGSGGGGGLSSAGAPIMKLVLTLWLAEPSYKPAFHVIAQPVYPSAHWERPMQPLYLTWDAWLLPVLEQCSLTWPSLSAPSSPSSRHQQQLPAPAQRQQKLQQQNRQQQLLVPLRVPFLTFAGRDGPGLVAGVVRWLGLYKYAAVRTTRTDGQGGAHGGARGEGGGEQQQQAGAAGDNGVGESCLYPIIILVGGRGAGTQRATSLLKISANSTYHSLEPCAADPWGCAAVVAVLDPACQYRLDLVPYATERLTALLLAHAAQLWLGAQLAALVAVAAAMMPSSSPTSSLSSSIKAAAAEKNKMQAAPSSPSPAQADTDGSYSVSRRWRLWFRGWPALPWEALVVLQAGLRRRRLLALLVTTAAIAAAVAALAPPSEPLPRPLHGTASTTIKTATRKTELSTPLRGTARPVEDGGGAASRAATVERDGGFAAAVWPQLRRGLATAGLCPQPQRDDCGWGASSLALLAPLAVLAPLMLQPPLALLALLAPPLAAAPPPAGDFLSAADWVALAAAALLTAWLMAALLQVGAAAAAVLQGALGLCWRVAVLLPYRLVQLPWRLARRLLPGWKAGGYGNSGGGGRNGPSGAAAESTTAARWAAVRRWAAWLAPLAALLVLTGMSSVIPGLALLASILSLAMSLTTPVRQPLPALDGAAPSEAGGTLEQPQRRRLAWLMYYTAYGICAAPAVAAAARRLALRASVVGEVYKAVCVMTAWGQARLQEGRGLEAALFGLLWLPAAASPLPLLAPLLRPAAAEEVSAWLAQSVVWALEMLQQGRGVDVVKAGLRWVATTAVGTAAPPPPLPSTTAAAMAVAGTLGYCFAAAHCGALACGPGAAAMRRQPQLRPGPLGGVRRFAAAAAVAVGCGLLALAWWLGAPDAAHVTAAIVSAVQLLAL